MYNLSDHSRLHGRSLSTRSGAAGLFLTLAYVALAIIAGVVFGTLSVHPF